MTAQTSMEMIFLLVSRHFLKNKIHNLISYIGNGTNLWQSILNDVAQRDDMKECHVLVLGDRGAGKRSLINAINKHCVRATNKFIEVEKMGSQYSGIDFEFLYVKDMSERDALQSLVTSDDNLPRMNMWVLQDSEKADLLKLVIKPDQLEYTAALIVLDFDQPWEMMEQLTKWTRLLTEVLQSFMKDIPLEQRDMLKNRIARHIKSFELQTPDQEVAKSDKKDKKSKKKNKGEDNQSDRDDEDSDFDMEHLKDALPLPEGVLKNNLGIPIIVACHKADLIGRGERS